MPKEISLNQFTLTKTCLSCGQAFCARDGKVKICSDSCRIEYRRDKDRKQHSKSYKTSANHRERVRLYNIAYFKKNHAAIRSQQRQRYAENAEAIREAEKLRRRLNGEIVRAQERARYHKNRDKIKAQAHARRIKNGEHMRAWSRQYYRDNPHIAERQREKQKEEQIIFHAVKELINPAPLKSDVLWFWNDDRCSRYYYDDEMLRPLYDELYDDSTSKRRRKVLHSMIYYRKNRVEVLKKIRQRKNLQTQHEAKLSPLQRRERRTSYLAKYNKENRTWLNAQMRANRELRREYVHARDKLNRLKRASMVKAAKELLLTQQGEQS